MKKNIASHIVHGMIVIAIGSFVFWQNNSTTVPPDKNNVNFSTAAISKAVLPLPNYRSTKTFMQSQIAEHTLRSSCWSIINGNVYDLTGWIPQHPGGEQAILRLCGKDGSEQYNAQHGGARRPALILGGFKIGILSK